MTSSYEAQNLLRAMRTSRGAPDPVQQGVLHAQCKARDFYYQHLAGREYSFDLMVRKTMEHFHTPENQQMYLREWEATNLKSIIAANPGKDLKPCLEMLVDKLLKISNGLSESQRPRRSGRPVGRSRGVPAVIPRS